ncbi:unnamed protein product [marine sediment metagenome]|uniref:JAB1/MPN/MOV34 metalloenzyme domain-containing protein n=1 Tax=marine sediment metagenome TaxID=412755 RepID=X1FLK2_9ZZZZ
MGKIKELRIKQSDVDKLLDWVDENAPIEACALLIGTIKRNIAYVDEVVLTPNVKPSSAEFKIDEELLGKIYLDAIENNKTVVGIFHSHPIGSYPSSIDIAYMEYNSHAVWLIRGHPRTEPMRGYQWVADEIVEVKLTITS